MRRNVSGSQLYLFDWFYVSLINHWFLLEIRNLIALGELRQPFDGLRFLWSTLSEILIGDKGV